MATISAATFNQIQQRAASVLGGGGYPPGVTQIPANADSRYGYGQSVASTTVLAGSVIRATSWINLRTDLAKARTHQIGSVGTGTGQGPAWANLANIGAGTVISNAIVTQYQGLSAQLVTDRFTAFSSQLGSTSVNSVRTATWGTTALTHSARVTFTDATQARYYFNAGGSIKYSATLTGGGLLPAGVGAVLGNLAKYNAWVNTLSGMGTLTFAVNQSSTTFGAFTVTKTGGTGTVTSITLSAVDQVIYTTTQSSPYATNTLTVTAKYITTTPYVVEITAVYTDGAAGAATGIGPAVDELVDGTLTGTATITPIQGAFAITPTIANNLTIT